MRPSIGPMDISSNCRPIGARARIGRQRQATSRPRPVASPISIPTIPPETEDRARSKLLPLLPIEADTNYVRHIRIQSERLSKFWGQPVSLGAILILPEGFESHPTARYPLVIEHGHFRAREQAAFARRRPTRSCRRSIWRGSSAECPNGHEKAPTAPSMAWSAWSRSMTTNSINSGPARISRG